MVSEEVEETPINIAGYKMYVIFSQEIYKFLCNNLSTQLTGKKKNQRRSKPSK